MVESSDIYSESSDVVCDLSTIQKNTEGESSLHTFYEDGTQSIDEACYG